MRENWSIKWYVAKVGCCDRALQDPCSADPLRLIVSSQKKCAPVQPPINLVCQLRALWFLTSTATLINGKAAKSEKHKLECNKNLRQSTANQFPVTVYVSYRCNALSIVKAYTTKTKQRPSCCWHRRHRLLSIMSGLACPNDKQAQWSVLTQTAATGTLNIPVGRISVSWIGAWIHHVAILVGESSCYGEIGWATSSYVAHNYEWLRSYLAYFFEKRRHCDRPLFFFAF